ncbi:MAG: hypothetical protein RSG52_05460 [Terrisporobacter sp.]
MDKIFVLLNKKGFLYMIVNITDLAKVALDDMFKQYDLYNKDAINQNKYIRVYIKEIA